MMALKLERIYTQPADLDGYRILVDHLWPRGMSKEKAHLDEWLKEVGPTKELRQWFNHEPAKFPDFKAQYLAELAANPAFATLEQTVADHLKDGNVILLYGAKDPVHNQAVILKETLEAGLGL